MIGAATAPDAFAQRSPEPGVDVFIVAGQSNAIARGALVDQLPESMPALPANLGVHDASFDWVLKPMEGRFGPEFSFAHAVGRAFPDRRIVIAKYAVDGSSSLDWAPEHDPERAAITRGRTAFGPVYDRAIAHVRAAVGERPASYRGVLWMQGERDARIAESADGYEEQLRDIIKALRADLATPDIPVIIARVNPPRSYRGLDDVLAGMEAIAANDPHVGLIETEGLTKLNDGLHYDTLGTFELGKRFARAWFAITDRPVGEAAAFLADAPAPLLAKLEELRQAWTKHSRIASRHYQSVIDSEPVTQARKRVSEAREMHGPRSDARQEAFASFRAVLQQALEAGPEWVEAKAQMDALEPKIEAVRWEILMYGLTPAASE